MLVRRMAQVLAAVAIVGAAASTGNAAGVELVREGSPTARIYVSSPPEEEHPAGGPKTKSRKPQLAETAASDLAPAELNYHLGKMSGAKLEVVVAEKAGDVKGPAVVLGRLAVALGAEPHKTSQTKEGFRILVKDKLVLIGGQSEVGTLYGVYELLTMLGCDWVMPGEIGEIIPASQTVTVPEMDVSQAPDFQMRQLYYTPWKNGPMAGPFERFAVWLRRQRGRPDLHPLMNAGSHEWGNFIRRHKDEFDKDPTMLALRKEPDGTLVRKGQQLESTHPRVVELFVQDILNQMRGQPKDAAGAFSIGPSDGLGYSLSAESLAAGAGRIDPVMGDLDRTDEVVLLGNRVLEQVHKEYPNVYVGFYSYSVHGDYPARYTPDPKMVVIFAPINFSRFHSLLDENSKSQAYYRGVVEQWGALAGKQGNPLFYRGYNFNLAECMLPFCKARIWGLEVPFYKTMGFLGFKVQGTKAWSVNGPADYVFMKLSWDSSRNWKDLLGQYCRKAFGEAARPMEEYFLRIIEAQHGAGQEAGSYHAYGLIYSDAWVNQSKKIIDQALAAAKTPADRTRVEYFGYGLKALELYLDYHKATMRFDFPVVKAAYDAMVAHWESTYKVNDDLVANEVPIFLKRYIWKFVEDGLRYSTGEYKMVYRIPDELPTMLDPLEAGQRMNYQSPAINDSSFIRTRTYSTTWDAQGLGGLRTGAVWYRVRFTLPPGTSGKPIGLFIGGADNEARVWINGRSIGSGGRKFSTPFVYDLTDGVRYDGENLLAIQVVRNSTATELGLGGIIRPSFLFTGPRLADKPAQPPKEDKQEEPLPGGGEVR